MDYTVMIRIDTYRYHTVSICYDTFYNGVWSSTYCICMLLLYSMFSVNNKLGLYKNHMVIIWYEIFI